MRPGEKIPVRPERLSLVLSWDLGPLRPWEWARLSGKDAEIWLEALAVQNAYREGIARARSDKEAMDHFDRQHPGQAG